MTAEQPDRDREVCDYSKTKPFYEKTVAEMVKATSVEGMEQSMFALREMHQLKAVGKGISIDFDDANKTIRMGFEVVEADTINKIKKGILPALSQGGHMWATRFPILFLWDVFVTLLILEKYLLSTAGAYQQPLSIRSRVSRSRL